MAKKTNSDILKGSMLQVFLDGEQGTQGQTVAFATSHTFNMTINTNEVNTKDHGDYPGVIPSNISWEVSTENLYSVEAIDDLLAKAHNKQPVHIAFAEVKNYNHSDEPGIIQPSGKSEDTWTAGAVLAEGDAIITSFSVNAAAGDNASISCTFTGNGALTFPARPTT